jgi:DNA-binding XRE family transcriptional regulator
MPLAADLTKNHARPSVKTIVLCAFALRLGILWWMRPAGMSLSEAFSRVMKEHREQEALSQWALARKAKLHQTTIGLLERGERSPNLDTANAIAQALGKPLAELIDEASRLQSGSKRR